MTTLFNDGFLGRPRVELPVGAHHLPGWLTLEQQRWISEQFRRWVAGPVPLHAPTVRGYEMSVRTVCLGWHWQPYKYTRLATDVNGNKVLDFPEWMVRLGREAVVDATGLASNYTPDAALVNYYDDTAKMGMHQDKDERSDAPVVSLSIGNTCRFRFGNSVDRKKPYDDIDLASGDLFVFGGPARFAFHGVTKVYPDTAPAGCGLDGGRINITMRMTGLS